MRLQPGNIDSLDPLFSNLRGSVSIKGTNKVKEATEAREANLSQKNLNGCWMERCDGSKKETDIREVLDALKPYDGDLKKLGIMNYCGLLSIQHMDNVKVVGSEFFRNDVSFPSLEVLRDVVFPCLKELRITDCSSLVDFSFEGDTVLTFLKELCIKGSSNLIEVSVEALPSLRVLTINRCGDGVLRSVVRVAPSVTVLNIRYISGLSNAM
ncbi:NBS-LRR resistance-like protein [Tanacetum coccineum]